MEQDLDAAGQLISRLQRELTDERHAYDAINARYTQMMGAAENLQHQIDAASFLKDPLQASLATLVAQIEEMVPELDQDKKDIDSTCAVTRRRFPVGARPTRRSLQPEATGAGMEVTKCLKPPDSGHEFGDRASVQAATRVNAEQTSKRSMCRPTR